MMKKKRPSLLINAISNWTALATAVIVGFFLTPYIISYIGKTGFGIWTLIVSIIGYYGILDLGVSSAIKRYVAYYAGQQNYKALNETINTAFVMFCVVGLVVVLASLILAVPLSKFFNISYNNINEFQKVVYLLGLTAGIGFPGNLFGAVIRAHERFVVANSVNIFTTLFRAILTVLFLSNDFGITGIVYAHLICIILTLVFNFILFKTLFPHLELQLRMVRLNVLWVLLGFGAATTILSIADIMRFNLDSFVIGKWINISSVAEYGIAALIMRYFLQFVVNGTSVVFTPRYAAMDGEGEGELLKKLFMKSLSISAFVSFALGTVIIVFCKDFIILWVGADFLEALPALSVLAISYTIALAQTPGISLVYAIKKHYFFATASIIEGIANLALSIYLAPRYGILGVAIGTAAPMLIIKVFVQPWYVSKLIKISLKSYWIKILPVLGFSVCIIILGRNLPNLPYLNNEYISLILYSIAYMAIFLIYYFLLELIASRKIAR